MATEDSEPLLCPTAEVTAEVIAGVDAALAAPPPAASDAESMPAPPLSWPLRSNHKEGIDRDAFVGRYHDDAQQGASTLRPADCREMIDNALLRPGRLEVHAEIGLPDYKGRLQMLGIHTKSMKDSNRISKEFMDRLDEVSEKKKNFGGGNREIGETGIVVCADVLCRC